MSIGGVNGLVDGWSKDIKEEEMGGWVGERMYLRPPGGNQGHTIREHVEAISLQGNRTVE